MKSWIANFFRPRRRRPNLLSPPRVPAKRHYVQITDVAPAQRSDPFSATPLGYPPSKLASSGYRYHHIQDIFTTAHTKKIQQNGRRQACDVQHDLGFQQRRRRSVGW
jgi:hypothetical protein